jgi:hypothetical protein
MHKKPNHLALVLVLQNLHPGSNPGGASTFLLRKFEGQRALARDGPASQSIDRSVRHSGPPSYVVSASARPRWPPDWLHRVQLLRDSRAVTLILGSGSSAPGDPCCRLHLKPRRRQLCSTHRGDAPAVSKARSMPADPQTQLLRRLAARVRRATCWDGRLRG